jgi:cytochrome c peroxidase
LLTEGNTPQHRQTTKIANMPFSSRRFFIVMLCTFYSFALLSCKKKESAAINSYAAYLNLPDDPYNYAAQPLPAHLLLGVPGQDNTPGINPVTDWGATLGRVLFYDRNISINNAVSCASCHNQQAGFADNLAFSKGFSNGVTTRNSMSLVNAKYYPNGTFFWDQRAATLEAQVLQPIQHPVEMGMNLDTMTRRLQALPYYNTLFTNAFGSTTITSDRVSKALSQFIRSMISYQSKYDIGRQNFPATQIPPNTIFPNFTAEENRGKAIFLGPIGGCAACHGSESFTAPGPKNNGLELVSVDRGIGAIVNNASRDGQFKVPSLKNIELSAPYMHDGRFSTLEDVVEHYSSGVLPHPNLSNELKQPNGQPRNANLTTQDKAALVAFLKTLTDRQLSTDVKFGNPFK